MYKQGFAEGIRPDPVLTVSAWADANRMLSQKASAEPGPWRTDRTPYLREVMDSLGATAPNQETSLMKGAQLGGSEAGNNWLAYIMAHVPGPTLAVMPTVEMAKRNSKSRIDPMIDACPALKSKVVEKQAGDRRSHETVLQKDFPGGVLVMTGANSAAGLRSMPARFLFLDEIDAYPHDVDGEGDPINLAIARARTYPRRKIFRCSTPTIEGHSRISAAFEEGSGEYYHVPCPHCGEMQRLVWANIKWPKGKPEEAQYQCSGCQKPIPEHHKTWMLEHGEWWATHPDRKNRHRSFHLSSLYSPVGWFSWAEAARLWETAHKDPNRLKTFVNTVLGECWRDRGEAPEWRRLYDRRERYPKDVVPRRALFLTAGTDIQKDRIEVSVYGWGRGKESWLITHVVLDGSTADQAVWDRLTVLLNATFPHESGVSLNISKMAIDSGFRTNETYLWARHQPPGRVIVIKGVDHGSAPVGQPTAQDVSQAGKKIARGIKLWPVTTPILKSELYGWLNLEPPTEESNQPYPSGYCHFTAEATDEEFFRQLTAEQLLLKTVKGFTRMEWMKTYERNETLDCRVYATAAALVAGIDHFNEYAWGTMENSLKTATNPSRPLQQPRPQRPVLTRLF